MKLRFLLTFLLCFAVASSQAGNIHHTDDNNDSDPKPVTMVLRVPEPGVYAVSVVDKDIVNADTIQPSIINTILDNSMLLRDTSNVVPLKYDFETEQVISGKVKRILSKVKNPQIIVFNPANGERQDYSLENHQSFNLLGFDIEEGGRLSIQATKENGKDNFVELEIKEPYFPAISMKEFLKDKDTLSLPPVNTEGLMASYKEIRERAHDKSVELDELVVQGQRIKPLNVFNFTPYRCFNEKDDILANGNSMYRVLCRLGLIITVKDGVRYPGCYRPSVGWGKLVFYVPAIRIDDCEVDSLNMDELWDLDPKDLKQVEYFIAEQKDAVWSMKGTPAGVLCIYTKNKYLYRSPISMKSIQPLGYRPKKTPYNPLKDRNYTQSTDHRVTLLWNPELVVDSTCKARITFMPSSTSKSYDVCVEGIGINGAVSCSRGTHHDLPHLSSKDEEALKGYLENTAREKAYIQTDRSQYCSGDTVWLRVHIADALSSIPSTSPLYPADRSNFVYVELHNNDGILYGDNNKSMNTRLERIMIKRDDRGVFSSYFVVPESLPSGNFTLVAYTRHMLNFKEEEFPYKQIQIKHFTE